MTVSKMRSNINVLNIISLFIKPNMASDYAVLIHLGGKILNFETKLS